MKTKKNPYFYEYIYDGLEKPLLKSYLHDVQGYSSRVLRRIAHDGKILVNHKKHWLDEPIKAGDHITLMLPAEAVDIAPTPADLDIIYEDDEIIAVNKDADVVTHPTRRHQDDTLGNFIADYFIKTGQQAKIRFVSRLDRDTSGIVVVAKNKYVHHYLQSHQVIPKSEKTYIAFVEGCPEKPAGTINAPIKRSEDDGIHRKVASDGKPSVTHFRVLQKYGNAASKVSLVLETGRTHQIRVHMAYIGCPIIGDHLYNHYLKVPFGRTALHSAKIRLFLPKTGEHLLTAPLKQDLIALEHELAKI